MELTKQDIEKIATHIDAAKICGITSMVFNNHQAYAISDDHSACIVSPCELTIPKAVSIGIGSINDFDKRFSNYRSSAVMTLEVRNDSKTKSIAFRTSKSKMTFRCTDHTKIQYFRNVNDEDCGTFEISRDEAVEIKKAISAMLKPEYLFLSISSNSEVAIKIRDQNNDEFECFLDAPFTPIDGRATITYMNKFDCKGPFMTSMHEFIKNGDRIGFTVTESGNIKAIFDSQVEVYLIPSVTSEDD